jgi:hypothetical protein
VTRPRGPPVTGGVPAGVSRPPVNGVLNGGAPVGAGAACSSEILCVKEHPYCNADEVFLTLTHVAAAFYECTINWQLGVCQFFLIRIALYDSVITGWIRFEREHPLRCQVAWKSTGLQRFFKIRAPFVSGVSWHATRGFFGFNLACLQLFQICQYGRGIYFFCKFFE